MRHFVSFIALIASCILLSNCGGGGGGGDGSPDTVRPKTMDGLRLILDGNVLFEFVRNTGSPPALVAGDVETGVFFYTLGGVQLRQYRNTNGDDSDVRYPDSVSTASYTYRAINPTSGVLTLTAFGINDLNTTGSFGANNGSFVYLFNSDSNFAVNNVVVIDLTFSTSGSGITANQATVMQPGGNPLYDNILVPTTISLASGGSVPPNYNPTIDPNRPSRIAATTLHDKLFRFTNGIPDPTLDFTVQFVADNGGISTGTSTTETGQGILRLAGVAVDDAINYTYTRIDGTDDATMVISNASGASTTLNGSYTLKFGGTDNGSYIGEVDADTPDAADVSGTFFIPGT